MKINIRRINEWDAPAILKIYAPYAGRLSAPDAAPPALSEMIERIDRYTYGYGWLICEVGGVPAGFCYVTECRTAPENPFDLEIYSFVKADYQRQSVGKAMFAMLSRILEEGNRRMLFAHIAAEDTQAACFFESLGFSTVKEEDGRLMMRYRLNPSDPAAEKITKPYLIDNKTYERIREESQNLVKPKI